MVLEHLVDNERVLRHPLFITVLTFLYVLVAYGMAYLLFPTQESLALVFLVTLMITPSLMHVMRLEEKIESRYGLRHFFRTHQLALRVYGLSFIGLVAGFLVVGSFDPSAYSTQIQMLADKGAIGSTVLEQFTRSTNTDPLNPILGVFTSNLLVLLICVALSLFYGAGAVFLIILNASLFAAFFSWITRAVSNPSLGYLGLIHLVPELLGFLLGAIAGATLSWALLEEKIGTSRFANVAKNACLMIVLAAVVLLIAAVLEVMVTAPLMNQMMVGY